MAQKNKVLKGFLMGIADYAQNKANETKLKAQLALNSEQMKQNWLWKLQSGLAERRLQNQATMDLVNQMGSQNGEGMSGNGSLGINSPETRVGSGGKLQVYYPSATDKEFKIKQTWAQIDKKQARGIPLNNLEKSFVETYPKETWIKRDINAEKFDVKQNETKKIQENKSQMVKDSAMDTLNTISEVEKGIDYFGLTGGLPSIPGTARATWEANVNKLLSGKIINLMTQMKEASKTGATGFGQLSEKELKVLQEASTALKRGLSPKDAQKYLNEMKVAAQKVLGSEIQQEGGQEVKSLDKQTAIQLLQKAGGDKNKARQMAQNMGYQF